jgi:hypothetical protein
MPNSARPARAAVRHAAPWLAALLAGACASSGGSSGTPASAGASPSSGITYSTTRVEIPSGGTYEVRTTADNRSIDAIYGASADAVWRVLPLVYDSLGIKLTAMDSQGRSLGTQNARTRRRLGGDAMSRSLSCGVGVTGEDNANSYDVYLTVMSAVEAQGADRAVVHTWVQANARPTATSGDPVRCGSTGWLERRIADLVAKRLAVGAR